MRQLEKDLPELLSFCLGTRRFFPLQNPKARNCAFLPTDIVIRACGPVGVGIAVARDPLRRSGQALLTHPAPTLGDNA